MKIVIAGIALTAFSFWAGIQSTDPMAQQNFPCSEDSYLGFSPESNTRVVCLSLEEVYGRAEALQGA